MRKRELCPSALCSFNHWATTNLLTSKVKQFVWGMSLAVLSWAWWLKKSLAVLSQTTDAWWLGNVADCLKLRSHNNQAASRGNCILGTIIMHLPDMAMWQLRNSNQITHQMFSTGAWKPGHETRNKAKAEYVFKTSFLFLPYISFHAKFELHGQALFQAFSASILNIEGRPKRYGSGLWCQVADDKDTLGEYLMKKLEWGPFLYL